MVIRFRQLKRCNAGTLQRCGYTDRYKIVDFAQPYSNLRTYKCIPDTPAGETVGLRENPGVGPVLHPVLCPDEDIFPAVIQDVFVNLIGDRDHVIVDTEVSNEPSSFLEKTLPVGLPGLLRMIARVFLVIAAFHVSSSIVKSSFS